MVTRRTVKTLLYKVSVILITQIVLFLLFESIILNSSMMFIEIIRIVWYYVFDWLFEEKIWKKARINEMPFQIDLTKYPLVSVSELSEHTDFRLTVDTQGTILLKGLKCPECQKEFNKKGDD